MSWVKLTSRDHNAIRKSKPMQQALAKEAARIADEANSRAGLSEGYTSTSELEPNPDLTVGGDRARAHVWASGAAVGAEKKNGILMGMADK
jgi:hypothetical protein